LHLELKNDKDNHIDHLFSSNYFVEKPDVIAKNNN